MSLLQPLRDREFFRLLNEEAAELRAGAAALDDMLRAFGDAEATRRHASRVRQHEHKGDDLGRQITQRLHRTFAPPLDRQDIHMIATKLALILDIVDALADRIELYAVVALTPEVLALGEGLAGIGAALAEVVERLGTLHSPEVHEAAGRVKRIEEDMDRHYRSGVASLFRDPDLAPLEVFKLKEILERMETAADECAGVADVIEGIALKHR